MAEDIKKLSKLALLSFILSLLSFLPLLGIAFGFFAVAVGVISLIVINRSNSGVRGNALAISAVIIGGLLGILLIPQLYGVMAKKSLPKVQQRLEESKINNVHAHLNAFSYSLNQYMNDNGRYPTTEQGLKALKQKPVSEPIPQKWRGPYPFISRYADPWGNDYIYASPGNINKDSYDLFSKGPNRMGDGTDSDDIGNWSQ